MKLARIVAFLVAAGILVGAPPSTRAEEITLKISKTGEMENVDDNRPVP